MFAYRHFENALALNDLKKAETIIINLINDNPKNIKYLVGYVDFIEKKFIDLDVVQMEKSLNFFTQAENKFLTYGFLTKGKLSEISELDQRIAKLKEIFYAKRKDVEKEIKNNAKKTNEEILTFLETELNKLDEAESEEQFDKILNEVKKAEKKLNLSTLEDSEKELYNSLIDQYANKITIRTQEFENKSLTIYNIECLDNLKYLIETFKKGKKKLTKNYEMLEDLLINNMFCYDTNKFFQSTLEYYQYCYTYIFVRLADTEKYKMSKLALTTRKK